MGRLSDAMPTLDKERILAIVKQDLGAGRDPLELIDEGRLGLETVGLRFERGDFFLVELLRAAQIFKSVAEILKPRIITSYGGVRTRGKVLLGTVAGDIHDLGKNIVGALLEAKGIEVIDLGVDVPAEVFVKKTKEHKPQVVGLSGLLTGCFQEMEKTIIALEEAGLRNDIKVICGGGIVGEVGVFMKADYAAKNANDGLRVIEQWLGQSI